MTTMNGWTLHREPVRPVRVELHCTACRVGEMKPTGQCYMTAPPQYPHECGSCGQRVTMWRTYPYIDYEAGL